VKNNVKQRHECLCLFILTFKRSVHRNSILRHPQHTQTSSNSSTIAADSSNGVTNNRCCRYSCLRAWWWVWYQPKHVEQFPDKINCVPLHLVGYILEYSCLRFTLELLYNNKETIILVYSLCTLHGHASKSQLLIRLPGTEQTKLRVYYIIRAYTKFKATAAPRN
jgi:hypothetical protein